MSALLPDQSVGPAPTNRTLLCRRPSDCDVAHTGNPQRDTPLCTASIDAVSLSRVGDGARACLQVELHVRRATGATYAAETRPSPVTVVDAPSVLKIASF